MLSATMIVIKIDRNVEEKKTASRCLLPSALCLLLLSLTASAQSGPPGPSSPLYGARPEAGSTSTGLPSALRDVGIDQKLDQQLPLDLVFRDENGQPVKLGQYLGNKPVVLP